MNRPMAREGAQSANRNSSCENHAAQDCTCSDDFSRALTEGTTKVVTTSISECAPDAETHDRPLLFREHPGIRDIGVGIRVISKDEPERHVDDRHLHAEFYSHRRAHVFKETG